ncbi:MAG: hypothetical protein IPK26_25195, partial [Planctomycetes bacterium]|nr:hypothetical protein [Planctomycetota bacterium]
MRNKFGWWVLASLVLCVTCVRKGSSGPAESKIGPTIDPVAQYTSSMSVKLTGRSLRAGSTLRVEGGASPQTVQLARTDRAIAIDVDLAANRLNSLLLTETFADGGTAAPLPMQIVQDSAPPDLQIDAPAPMGEVYSPTIAVIGRVGDLVTGAFGLQVFVNDVAAAVDLGTGTNGTFLATGIPVVEGGANLLQVRALDAAGNERVREVPFTHVILTGNRIEPVVGDLQTAPVRTVLPTPISVRVLRPDGSPFVGKVVEFRVIRSDGRLAADGGAVGELTYRVATDTAGIASAFWRTGSDAGVANNRV